MYTATKPKEIGTGENGIGTEICAAIDVRTAKATDTIIG